MSNDRAGLPPKRLTGPWALLASTAALCLLGCPPAKPVSIVPPPPPGDTLRLLGKTGDKVGGAVKVRVEKGDAGSSKKPKVLAFQLEEEHVVEKADESGNMHLTAKFFNVEAQGETPKEKKAGESMARALSEIQIAYDLTNRGDVTNFEVKNVPDSYISEARLIAATVYGAEHGPLFDAMPIEVNKGWQIRAQIPIPSGGSKNWEISCTYSKKERNVATIGIDGKVAGESQGTQLSGELKGDVRLDIGKGILVFEDVDAQSVFRSGGDSAGGHMLHVHITWEIAQPAAPAAGAAPAADGKATQIVP